MANTKISALTALANPTGSEEFVYAYNNANGKVTLNTMKSFIGGGGTVTTLSADANIWELAGGTYLTSYDLYYMTGEKVRRDEVTGASNKQMIFVVEETNGSRGFFVFNVGSESGNTASFISYGWSASAASGRSFEMGRKDWALREFYPQGLTGIDPFSASTITQIITNISDDVTNELSINQSNAPYPGLTYTVYVASVAAGKTYSISLGTGVTNPLNIALPSSSDKKCVITCFVTSSSAAIVTGCTIEN